MRIDWMGPWHLNAIAQIEQVSFPSPWSREHFESLLSRKSARMRVALVNRRVVGYFAWMLEGRRAHILNLAVHPDYRKRRIGSIMLTELLNEVRRERVLSVRLEVRVTNDAAQRLYRKFGFFPAGVERHYYPANPQRGVLVGEDALVMRKGIGGDVAKSA